MPSPALHPCEGAKYHSPTPLVTSEYVLDPKWGFTPIKDEERYFGDLSTAWLCGTCKDNVACYLALMALHDGLTVWPVRREFGNLTRQLGDRAWAKYMTFKSNEEHCRA